MSVIARSTPGSRRRRRRGDRVDAVAEAASGSHRAGPAAAAPRRPVDRPQDTATYSCGCGFQFAATVTTTVACPYCGDAQAW